MNIIKRAGLTPWPKLFHNLRSTRQTELEEVIPSGEGGTAGLSYQDIVPAPVSRWDGTALGETIKSAFAARYFAQSELAKALDKLPKDPPRE